MELQTLIALCTLALLAIPAQAAVRLHGLFKDGMVLQQRAEVPVWGKATEGERVNVSFCGQSQSTSADRAGNWSVLLHDLKPGGPFEMRVSGTNTVTVRDIMVGEVWVCSGQSNMAMTMSGEIMDYDKEAAQTDYPECRFFNEEFQLGCEPLKDCTGEWSICSSQTINKCSAAGYFFIRELHKILGVPIGLINASRGATPAESWTDAETLGARPVLAKYLFVRDYELQTTNREPYALTPTALYNGMIAPLIPFAIKGVIWYQGEGNSLRAEEYRTLFPDMIAGWRRNWQRGDFPFIFVQLPDIDISSVPEWKDSWTLTREAQLLALTEPNTGMAVTIDTGEPGNIHPTNKQLVGRRLALSALSVAYDKDLVGSGPIYLSAKFSTGSARVRFKHVGSGLVAKGSAKLEGFAVAGKDMIFVPAEASIEGDAVVVWNGTVKQPKAVRYGWADNPQCNLYNKEGLPASPFRTDRPKHLGHKK